MIGLYTRKTWLWFLFRKWMVLMKKNDVVVLYEFQNNFKSIYMAVECNVYISVKDNTTYFWHLKLGYVSKQKLKN